jgi:hypothetical protein
MIINHKRRFVFVHIQKTAGTSITQALQQINGSEKVFRQHSMLHVLDLDKYEDYFLFCFVRNPFDRLVSWWNMMNHKGFQNDFSQYLLSRASSFSEFLDCTDTIHETNEGEFPYPKSIAFNQLDYITTQEGRMAMDFIGRFENLEDDFDRICDRIGMKLKLPHSNAFERRHYREYYTSEDVLKVKSMYRRDLEYFKYEF